MLEGVWGKQEARTLHNCVCLCMCMWLSVHLCVSVCARVCVCVYVCICMQKSVCMCLCKSVCVCIYVCVHITVQYVYIFYQQCGFHSMDESLPYNLHGKRMLCNFQSTTALGTKTRHNIKAAELCNSQLGWCVARKQVHNLHLTRVLSMAAWRVCSASCLTVNRSPSRSRF